MCVCVCVKSKNKRKEATADLFSFTGSASSLKIDSIVLLSVMYHHPTGNPRTANSPRARYDASSDYATLAVGIVTGHSVSCGWGGSIGVAIAGDGDAPAPERGKAYRFSTVKN